jgi:hypothetical protein
MDHVKTMQELRARKGWALFWWWRGWVALALVAFRLGAPAWAVNARGSIAQW